MLSLLHQKRPAPIQRHKPEHFSNSLTYLAGFTIVTLPTLDALGTFTILNIRQGLQSETFAKRPLLAPASAGRQAQISILEIFNIFLWLKLISLDSRVRGNDKNR